MYSSSMLFRPWGDDGCNGVPWATATRSAAEDAGSGARVSGVSVLL